MISKKKFTVKERKDSDMKKYLICFCAAAMMVVLSGYETIYASSAKAAELRKKLVEITSLQQALNGKLSQAVDKREQFKEKMNLLKTEIIEEKDQRKIETYQTAILNHRIDYNLKLIQLLLGYITRLNEKIIYFQTGNEMLAFYFGQVQDDLLMIKTLNDLEIDKLIAQINLLLDEFIPQADKPMFDVNDIPQKDTEQIWNEITR